MLLIGQAAGGVIINAPLNGLLAWLMFPPVPSLPIWAKGNCIAGDTIGTSFFLPLITCLILTALTRRALRSGAMPGLPLASVPRALRWLPANMAGRGALVGLACALTVALITLFSISGAGVEGMTRGEVALFKAVYTGLLGGAVSPLFGLRALADVAPAGAVERG